MSNIYEKYMKVAISLAKKAEGMTSPNPIVGAVIVKGGKIVGRGYHRKAGLPHAEIEALKDAGSDANGAAMFVTLEPCDHFGRTPPCTDAVIKSGIRKVVIGMRDPNPVNNGAGIKKLKRNGIKIVAGVLEKEAMGINRPFIKFITKKMPYVTVKLAETLDGKIATRTGDSKWISSEESRRYVHGLRGAVDAVMVGVNTVLRDDPTLLSVLSVSKQPARVIVDSTLKTPASSKIFATLGRSDIIMAATDRAPSGRIKSFRDLGVEVIITKSKDGKVDLKTLLKGLARRDIVNILVEGGGELAASLAERRLVDRFLFFIAPKIAGGREAVGAIGGIGISRMKDALMFSKVEVGRSGPDILVDVRP